MTEKITTGGPSLGAFEDVLERFGSDRTRWPAPVRRTFAGLLAESPEARERLRQAEALDRLLDLAPEPAFDTRALADRILAAAEAETPAAARPPARSRWSVFERRPAGTHEAQWPAAALLAASLVLGGFFGLSGTFDTAVEPLVASTSYEIDPGQIALDSDAISLFEEDTL